jgi:hypothetical protein
MTEPRLNASDPAPVRPGGSEDLDQLADERDVVAVGASGPAPAPPAQRQPKRWMQRLVEETPATEPGEQDTEADPVADGPPADDPAAERPLGAGLLFLLGLFWLVATLWSARGSMAGIDDPVVMVSSVALTLPVTVVATLLAGAAGGLAAACRFAADRPASRRLWTGLTAGALCGALPAAAILAGYGATSAVAVIAITVLVAGLMGGAAAALSPATLAAGIAGTLTVFVIGVLLNLFQAPLKAFLGAGSTVASQYEAANLLARTGAAASGVAAGVIAFAYLRRRAPGAPWPAYLVAGAGAGLLLLLAEGLTLAGGSGLLELVSGLSAADREVLGYLDGERLVQALIVGFAGAIVALIAIGRATPRRTGPEGTSPEGTSPEGTGPEG